MLEELTLFGLVSAAITEVFYVPNDSSEKQNAVPLAECRNQCNTIIWINQVCLIKNATQLTPKWEILGINPSQT